MKREKVYHVNQKVVEYYQRDTLGWTLIAEEQAQYWKPSTFEYKELRHTMEISNGVYGRLINQ